MSAQVEGRSGPQGARIMGNADNNHWHQLGLECSPFDDVSPAYYPVQSWEEHLRYLQRFRAGPYPLLLIPGIVGSGKSTLIKRFLTAQNDKTHLRYIEALPHHSVDQFIHALYSHSQVEAPQEATIPEVLHQLTQLSKEMGPQLLLIDDAHRLPRETLMRLLQLLFQQDFEQSQCRVVLLGETQLQEVVMNLLDSFASGRQVPSLELEPLSLQEMREYLDFRLGHAGLTGKLPFSPAALKQIHILSGGYPGRVNRVAQQALLDSLRAGHEEKPSAGAMGSFLKTNKMKLMSALILFTASLSMWVFQPSKQLTQGMTADKNGTNLAAMNASQNEVAMSSSADDVAMSASQSEEASNPSPTEVATVSPNEAASNRSQTEVAMSPSQSELALNRSRTELPMSASEIDAVLSASKDATAKRSSQQVVALNRSQNGTVENARQESALAAVTELTQDMREAIAQAVNHLDASESLAYGQDEYLTMPLVPNQHLCHGAVMGDAPKVLLADQSGDSANARKLPTITMASFDSITSAERQLLQSQGFTIQLMGARKPQVLESFIAQNKLDGLSYYRTKRNKQDWYVLVYGHFQSLEEANVALGKLPKNFHKHQAWVRSLDGVHEAIAVARQKQDSKVGSKVAVR